MHFVVHRALGPFSLGAVGFYRSQRWEFEKNVDHGTWLFDPAVDGATEIDRRQLLRIDVDRIDVGLQLSLDVTEGLMIGLSPRLGLPLGFRPEQTEEITGPSDIAFADGQRTRVMLEGPRYEQSDFYFSMATDVRLRLPAARETTLEIGVGLVGDLGGGVTTLETWQGLSASGSIGFSYRRRPDAPSPPLPPTISSPQFPPAPPLQVPLAAMPPVSIDLFGDADATAPEIVVRFLEVDRIVTFVPTDNQFVVERGEFDAAIPILGQTSIDSLLLESGTLAATTIIDLMIHRALPDTTAKLLLITGVGGVAPSEEVKERIRALGFPVGRIVDSTAKELPEGHLILAATSSVVSTPYRITRLERELVAPSLRIRTSQRSIFDRWDINVATDGVAVGGFSSAATLRPEGIGLDWNLLYSESPRDTTVLRATLTVRDSLGRTGRAVDDIALIVARNRFSVLEVVRGNGTTAIFLPFPSQPSVEIFESYGQLIERFAERIGVDPKVRLVQPVNGSTLDGDWTGQLRKALEAIDPSYTTGRTSDLVELPGLPKEDAQQRALLVRGGVLLGG